MIRKRILPPLQPVTVDGVTALAPDTPLPGLDGQDPFRSPPESRYPALDHGDDGHMAGLDSK
ncbi:hypothetical protein [Halorhabdus salina]|uniref:hypothetical protein n=1 Tax=Halorhabdus salina TaxID=2750670 RepID=UPI0015EE4FAD|nr:hypothetical protein [Halorhabdus salina]